MEPTLSLGAELLLVATNPNRGGFLKRHRRRFRRALAAAAGLLAGWLSRDERRLAVRRLQHWQTSPNANLAPLAGLGLYATLGLGIEASTSHFGGDSGSDFGGGFGGFEGGGGDGGGGGQ